MDLGFHYLHPRIAQLYPELTTLPAVPQVLAWQQRYAAWVKLQRDSQHERLAPSGEVAQQIEREANALREEELKWAPPPHLSHWKTPVPLSFFREAAGIYPTWDLRSRHSSDLVPVEQIRLVQDVPLLPLDSICTADARACISLCRPVGHFVHKRQRKTRGRFEDVQPHQSGDLCMRPLTPEEDSARGMLTGLVATDAFTREHMTLREEERNVLPAILEWLRRENPWFHAYASSLQDVTK